MTAVAASVSLPTAVVHLEMTRPPAAAVHPPLNRQVALLRAPGIPLAYYRFLMDQVGRKWHWVSRMRMSDDQLSSILRDPRCDVTVLYLDGSPAGFFELFRSRPERVELSYFGMMERATGQGLGRWFLHSAIASGWSTGPDTLAVQTCTLDHPAALPLYQKLGFSPVGREETVIFPLTEEERTAALSRA